MLAMPPPAAWPGQCRTRAKSYRIEARGSMMSQHRCRRSQHIWRRRTVYRKCHSRVLEFFSMNGYAVCMEWIKG